MTNAAQVSNFNEVIRGKKLTSSADVKATLREIDRNFSRILWELHEPDEDIHIGNMLFPSEAQGTAAFQLVLDDYIVKAQAQQEDLMRIYMVMMELEKSFNSKV